MFASRGTPLLLLGLGMLATSWLLAAFGDGSPYFHNLLAVLGLVPCVVGGRLLLRDDLRNRNSALVRWQLLSPLLVVLGPLGAAFGSDGGSITAGLVVMLAGICLLLSRTQLVEMGRHH